MNLVLYLNSLTNEEDFLNRYSIRIENVSNVDYPFSHGTYRRPSNCIYLYHKKMHAKIHMKEDVFNRMSEREPFLASFDSYRDFVQYALNRGER